MRRSGRLYRQKEVARWLNLKILKQIFTALATMILGMMGGQGKFGGKATRRFMIPGFATVTALTDGFDWKDLSFLLLVVALSLGYGKNSDLMGFLGQEWLVRWAYSLILSLPFYLHGLKRGLFASVSLLAAFQIRAGSLCHIGWFGDILIEDIARFGTLGVLIVFNMFNRAVHS